MSPAIPASPDRDRPTVREIEGWLQQRSRTKHFELWYGLRNPRIGVGLGRMGVELGADPTKNLIHHYANALEKTYETMVRKGWREPDLQHEGRIRVLVFDTAVRMNGENAPFVELDEKRRLYIGLRSILDEPSLETMLQRAEVEAAHETVHVFNRKARQLKQRAVESSYHRQLITHWRWFDEATAVSMERQVFPNHLESMRYAIHWVCQPELELGAELELGDQEWFGGYCAALFVEYLVESQDWTWDHTLDDSDRGWGLIRMMWNDTEKYQTPISTLDRLIKQQYEQTRTGRGGADWPHEVGFAALFAGRGLPRELRRSTRCRGDKDALCHKDRLCRDNYCVRSYFAECFAEHVYERFGRRSVTEGLELPLDQEAEREGGGPLRPLACRYYRLYPTTTPSWVQVELTVETPPGSCAISAALLPVMPGSGADTVRPGGPTAFLDTVPNSDPNRTTFAGEIDCPTGGHVALVVANHYFIRDMNTDRDQHASQSYRFRTKAFRPTCIQLQGVRP